MWKEEYITSKKYLKINLMKTIKKSVNFSIAVNCFVYLSMGAHVLIIEISVTKSPTFRMTEIYLSS
jgi:hypothetical protein